MADRLNKIVTRGGDKGETSLADGVRVAKDDPRIALIGEVDELNCWIGVALSHLEAGAVADLLAAVQHDLFDLGGGLATPGAPLLSVSHVARLDAAAAELNAELPPLKEFILPGGAPVLAWLHVARAVARRAERAMVAFERTTPESVLALQYLNRLSDCLFIAARYEARCRGVAETYWRRDRAVQDPGAIKG